MRMVEEEKDIDVLRAWLKYTIGENRKLQELIHKSQDELASQAQQSFNLDIQLTKLKKLIFGKKSEKRKRPEATDRPRGQDEEDLLLHSQNLLPPLKENQHQELESESLEYRLSDEELAAESKDRGVANPESDQWEEIPGLHDKSVEITVIERQYKKLIHKRKKYRLKKEFNSSDKEIIITAPGPEKLLPGSQYSIDFAVSVVTDKYVSHTPLERQTREMHSLGLRNIKTKTLSNLCQAVAIYSEPVTLRIKNEIFTLNGVVHADETTWKIQIKEQDSGYMWVISNQAGAYYAFEPTRSGKIIKALLEDYTGVVVADGYVGYNRLKNFKNIEIANCWAHARRKFTDIQEYYPTECERVLRVMDELFDIERQAKSFSELKSLRKEKSEPLTKQLNTLFYELLPDARGESYLKEAIEYNLKYWPGLTKFITNEKIPMTNNEAERTIRHAVMGRKNFYGSRNHNGADTAAILYTIIESCKRLEVDPRTYFNMLVRLSVRGEPVPTPLEYAKQLRQ